MKHENTPRNRHDDKMNQYKFEHLPTNIQDWKCK